MTDFAITEQLSAIRQATDNALKSKETALKFLQDAGIIKEKNNPTPTVSQNTNINTIKSTAKKD